jgi:hypothetical protein
MFVCIGARKSTMNQLYSKVANVKFLYCLQI